LVDPGQQEAGLGREAPHHLRGKRGAGGCNVCDAGGLRRANGFAHAHKLTVPRGS
jgi:hypothetical protein